MGFRFPVVGTLPYKGFFDPAAAEAEAERLRDRGLDVCTSAVRAYSTLGWLDDPLTGPMLDGDDVELVETLLHEFVHATAHVASAADFNEGVATFIGQEATVDFLASHDVAGEARSRAELVALARARARDTRRVMNALQLLRGDVSSLYRRTDLDDDTLGGERRRLEAATRARVAALRLETRDATQLARHLRLGDACLALRATYGDDLEHHHRVFEALGSDLRAFVAHLRESVRAADAELVRERFFAPRPRDTTTRTGPAADFARGAGFE